MPIFPSRECWSDLFLMAEQFGGIVSSAKDCQLWNKKRLADLGRTLTGVIAPSGETTLDASCFMAVRCREPAVDLMDSIYEALTEYDEVDPLTVNDQLSAIGEPLADLIGCLMNHYAVASDLTLQDQIFTDWPTDENWLVTEKPERLRTVR